MSLVKLLMAPMRFFQKDVIAFLVVRRYDLGITDDLIRYVTVKPSASIATLRYKIWHLLDLPDYCEEVIILKTSDNVEIPLADLRKGNEPGRPFILEVWLPRKPSLSQNHMLTMGRNEDVTTENVTLSSECSCDCGKAEKPHCTLTVNDCDSSMTEEALILNKLRVTDRQTSFLPGIRKSEVSTRISNSSFIFKVPGTRIQDNFANVLLKIQSDLSMLGKKLSNLENKIPM